MALALKNKRLARKRKRMLGMLVETMIDDTLSSFSHYNFDFTYEYTELNT